MSVVSLVPAIDVHPVGGVIVAPLPPDTLMQAIMMSFDRNPAGIVMASELAGVLAVFADDDERKVAAILLKQEESC
jgi:hypothetical protein